MPDDHTPDWDEAVARYELLQAEGPTPAAFDFKQAFDALGCPHKIDLERVRQLVARSE